MVGTWRLADGPLRRRFSFEGSRGVGRHRARTAHVKSITEQIQHTLNIAKVTAQAKGQPALRRVAPRRSPASLDAVQCSQPEVDNNRMMTMTSRRWRVGQRAVLTNFWPLRWLQPTYVRCPEGKPSWLPDRLLDQGRNVAEYLAVLPSRDARVIGVLEWKALCAGFTGPED
jgi:hypothetical protein